MMHGYGLVKKLCTELQDFMRMHDFSSIEDFRGYVPFTFFFFVVEKLVLETIWMNYLSFQYISGYHVRNTWLCCATSKRSFLCAKLPSTIVLLKSNEWALDVVDHHRHESSGGSLRYFFVTHVTKYRTRLVKEHAPCKNWKRIPLLKLEKNNFPWKTKK